MIIVSIWVWFGIRNKKSLRGSGRKFVLILKFSLTHCSEQVSVVTRRGKQLKERTSCLPCPLWALTAMWSP